MPGVYIFYAKDGTVLYVGKSRSIRQRVLSHFSGEYTQKEHAIARDVSRIEARVTAGAHT